ncbi:MAG TPA: inositol-3-phosphate synthase [Methylomirabilota bacterium]|nr:inositol-3-phosphate synthase [Methylomirabilota bacterium]
MGRTIRIAIVGVGNCASSLLQGIEYYRHVAQAARAPLIGLMHDAIGDYTPADIEPVCAFDIDQRKVGRPLADAAFAKPNNAKVIWPTLPWTTVPVHMGPVLDGVSPHLEQYPEDRRFVVASHSPVDVARVLRQSRAEIALNYLPVGSRLAAEYYARACLEAGVSLINCMPVFLVSQMEWAEQFRRRGIPVVGDDIKSQLGATILHRTLAQLFADRGVAITRTYQLNTGGNTDFLTMLSRDRLAAKKRSKTEAVQSVLPTPLPAEHIHIGPSDYVPWQEDQKICFLRLEGRIFGNMPIELEARLVVEDSPNSAGAAIDAIRCCQLARDRGVGGPLTSISAYTMKHPPQQLPDAAARLLVERFIRGEIER